MGQGMARNILRAGLDLRIWNRTRDKAAGLTELGAYVAADPADAVLGADLIVTMLFDADSIADVVGPLTTGLSGDAIWVQMSTVGVDGCDRLAELAEGLGLTFVDAPVLGSKKQAEDGALTVLASGPDRVRDRCAGLFDAVGGRTLWHEDYLPLWKEIEKLGKPLSTHDSASASVPSFGDRMDTHVSGHILSHPFEAMAAMAGLIWFGVFEQCPKLKVIHVEGDGGWTPYWLQRMEQHWDFSGNSEHEYLTRRPTEYFRSNVCVAFRGDEPTMKAAVELVGDDNFTWDSDYPHPDGTYPWGVEAMLKQPIPKESKRKLFWDNAARVFNLA